jgi:hypothetical protein
MTAPFLLDEMFDESTCLAGPFHICRAALGQAEPILRTGGPAVQDYREALAGPTGFRSPGFLGINDGATTKQR